MKVTDQSSPAAKLRHNYRAPRASYMDRDGWRRSHSRGKSEGCYKLNQNCRAPGLTWIWESTKNLRNLYSVSRYLRKKEWWLWEHGQTVPRNRHRWRTTLSSSFADPCRQPNRGKWQVWMNEGQKSSWGLRHCNLKGEKRRTLLGNGRGSPRLCPSGFATLQRHLNNYLNLT